MKKIPTAFKEFTELSRQVHNYQAVLQLLHWDQETYMPPGAIAARSGQIAQLSSLIHQKKTGREYRNLLGKLVSLSTGKPRMRGLSRPMLACLREWHRDFLKQDRLPTSFVGKFAEVTVEASQIWATAKKENNFKLFAPFLEKIIGLCRKKAELLGFEDHPYDALVETYEPCMTTHRLTGIFEGLQKELSGLLGKILSAKRIENRFLSKPVSDAKQMELAHAFLNKLPIDPAYSRLDLSAHPFSIALHPHDSRITTRILPKAFFSNILSILHEAGHSMYEMGLPADQWGTPLAESVSLSIHESQSRWWETLIGKSYPFWLAFYPMLRKHLPFLRQVSLERFYRAINQVSPSLIRVEADEVTYCLHVILRFEIEKALISGKLDVADLPEAWNGKMQKFFGMTPPGDAQGCLQDIHWSLGDFGYFPTYALGNLCAAQFFSVFAKKHANWEKRVEKGELAFIRDWLKENIHCHGRTYSSDELIKKVTGKPLGETAYCSYLKKKYAAIYAF